MKHNQPDQMPKQIYRGRGSRSARPANSMASNSNGTNALKTYLVGHKFDFPLDISLN